MSRCIGRCGTTCLGNEWAHAPKRELVSKSKYRTLPWPHTRLSRSRDVELAQHTKHNTLDILTHAGRTKSPARLFVFTKRFAWQCEHSRTSIICGRTFVCGVLIAVRLLYCRRIFHLDMRADICFNIGFQYSKYLRSLLLRMRTRERSHSKSAENWNIKRKFQFHFNQPFC